MLASLGWFAQVTQSAQPERIHINLDADPKYLPYELDTIKEGTPYPATPDGFHYADVSRALTSNSDTTRIVLAINHQGDVDHKNRFNGRFYPGMGTAYEAPVDYIIRGWGVLRDDTGAYQILATGYTKDSAYIELLDPESSPPHRLKRALMATTVPDPDSTWAPEIRISEAYDYDGDGALEVLCHIGGVPEPRELCMVQLPELEIEWHKSVSAPIFFMDRLIPVIDDPGPAVIFSTINPANGAYDDSFSDHFGYLARLSVDGIIQDNRVINTNWKVQSRICQVPHQDRLLVSHTSWVSPDSAVGEETREFSLSVVNSDFEIEQTRPILGMVSQIAFLPYGDPPVQRIMLVYQGSGGVEILDADLNTVAIDDDAKMHSFLDTTRLPGLDGPALVFKDGIYNSRLKKQVAFPEAIRNSISGFTPLRYDSEGNLQEFVIDVFDRYYALRVQRKGIVALASVFYHNNQDYILMLFSGLVVGLVAVALSRRRARRNLALIARQKQELEQIHEKLKATQQKLIEAEKYKQAKDIAGGFAHEIRNALFPADGLLGKMLRGARKLPPLPEALREYCTDAHDAVGRAIDITEQISGYTKLESQHAPEPVVIREVIEKTIKANRTRIDEQGVVISMQIHNGTAISANSSQCYIVFNNLLLNALDALQGNANPAITIAAENGDGTVTVRYRDNGSGIPEEHTARIFDTFFSTKPQTGTGLGLAMTKKIVELYGGSIAVCSMPNEYTEFTLTFKGLHSHARQN